MSLPEVKHVASPPGLLSLCGAYEFTNAQEFAEGRRRYHDMMPEDVLETCSVCLVELTSLLVKDGAVT